LFAATTAANRQHGRTKLTIYQMLTATGSLDKQHNSSENYLRAN